jgi:hypothetical protein
LDANVAANTADAAGLVAVVQQLTKFMVRVVTAIQVMGTDVMASFEQTASRVARVETQIISDHDLLDGKFTTLDSKVRGIVKQISTDHAKLDSKFQELDQQAEREVKKAGDVIDKVMGSAKTKFADMDVQVTQAKSSFDDLVGRLESKFTEVNMKIANMDKVVDLVSKMEGKMTYMEGMSIPVRLGNVEQSVSEVKLQVSNGKGTGKGGSSEQQRRRGIMESKAIQGIKTLTNERSGFRMWHDKLVNAFAQTEGGYRIVMEEITRCLDQGKSMDFGSGSDRQEWLLETFENSEDDEMIKLSSRV